MNKTLALAASFTAISLLAGCASTGAPSVPMGDRSYSESNSRAYNLAQAGGLREARDTELGAAEYSSMMSDLSGGASTALSLSSSAGFGLSGGTSLGLGLASALLSGPGMMQVDSAFAFVPSNAAANEKEASEVIKEHFYNAVHEVALKNDFELEIFEQNMSVPHGRYRNIMGIGLINEDIGCIRDEQAQGSHELCYISILTPHKGSTLRETPKAVNHTTTSSSYQYNASNSSHAISIILSLSDSLKAQLEDEGAELARLRLLQDFSASMPEWFFIYESSKENTPPLILENGNIELFVKPS